MYEEGNVSNSELFVSLSCMYDEGGGVVRCIYVVEYLEEGNVSLLSSTQCVWQYRIVFLLSLKYNSLSASCSCPILFK